MHYPLHASVQLPFVTIRKVISGSSVFFFHSAGADIPDEWIVLVSFPSLDWLDFHRKSVCEHTNAYLNRLIRISRSMLVEFYSYKKKGFDIGLIRIKSMRKTCWTEMIEQISIEWVKCTWSTVRKKKKKGERKWNEIRKWTLLTDWPLARRYQSSRVCVGSTLCLMYGTCLGQCQIQCCSPALLLLLFSLSSSI